MRKPVPLALLELLLSGPMPPESLRDLGTQHGKRHAVNVAIERMRRDGLIEVQARLTSAGRRLARKARTHV